MHLRTILSLSAFLATASCLALETRFQDFTTDPNWSTLGSGQNGNDLGWSATSFAGGSPGEIGGRFTRSNFVRYLADTDLGGGFTIDEGFSALGTFSYSDHNIPDFGNGFTIGHFSQGVADANDNGTKVGISFSDNSQRQELWWQGSVYLDNGIPLLTPPLPISANDVLHWSYDLVPDINGAGDALFTFNLNGLVSTVHLDTAQQQDLRGSLDSFGMIGSTVGENPQSNWFADMYIDDVNYSVVSNASPPIPTLPMRTENFDADSLWVGNGLNQDESLGTDFGLSPTSNAGGELGEAGGAFARNSTQPVGFFADLSIGELTLDDNLSASGRVLVRNINFNGHADIGFFDASRVLDDPLDYGGRIGMRFAEPSVSDDFQLGVFLTTDAGVPSAVGQWSPAMPPRLAPQDSVLDFEMTYNASGGNSGNGILSLTVGDEPTLTYELSAEEREVGASFDAFGVLTGPHLCCPNPSLLMELFIDDVTYSIAPPPLAGDFDNNGTVGQRDLDIVLLFWGEDVNTIPIQFDGFQPEGLMDQQELDAVLLNWGQSQQIGVVGVPEPAATMSLLICIAVCAVLPINARRE